jgi:hypothetical protein
MEILPEDIIKRIFDFLSLKERLFMREVCFFFKNNTSSTLILSNIFDNLLNITHSIENKTSNNLICYIAYNNFTIFKTKEPERVHSLFRIHNNYEKCINVICREKKLGYLYFSKKPTQSYHKIYNKCFYIKRNIPYCSNCFKYWTL